MPKYEYHVAIFYGGAEEGEWTRDIEIQNRHGEEIMSRQLLGREITSRQPLDKWLERVTSRPGGEVISITQTNDILTAIVRTDDRDEDDHDD